MPILHGSIQKPAICQPVVSNKVFALGMYQLPYYSFIIYVGDKSFWFSLVKV